MAEIWWLQFAHRALKNSWQNFSIPDRLVHSDMGLQQTLAYIKSDISDASMT